MKIEETTFGTITIDRKTDYRSHQRLFGLLLASFTTAHLSMNAATGGTCLATAGGLRYPKPP